MYTQCPFCNTLFRVRAEQLRAGRGRVHCSRCDNIFNALENLRESAPAEKEEWPNSLFADSTSSQPDSSEISLRDFEVGFKDDPREDSSFEYDDLLNISTDPFPRSEDINLDLGDIDIGLNDVGTEGKRAEPDLGEIDSDLANLESALEEPESELEDLESELRELEPQLQELVSELDDLDDESEQLIPLPGNPTPREDEPRSGSADDTFKEETEKPAWHSGVSYQEPDEPDNSENAESDFTELASQLESIEPGFDDLVSELEDLEAESEQLLTIAEAPATTMGALGSNGAPGVAATEDEEPDSYLEETDLEPEAFEAETYTTPVEYDPGEAVEEESAAEETDVLPAAEPEQRDPLSIEATLTEEREKKGGRIFWTLGCILLILVAIAQVSWLGRQELMRYPEGRKLLGAVCMISRCQLPPRRAPKQFRVLSRSIISHPEVPNALKINITFINKAEFPQPYPKLRIGLYNRDQKLLVQRYFNPLEYLGRNPDKAELLEPEQALEIEMDVEDPGKDVTGFKLDFF